MGKFFETEFFPKNFILMGNDLPEQRKLAEFIAMEAATMFPEEFKGTRRAFPFELRYAAPFEKDFYELKRLQGTAAVTAGYRNEYLGYVIIDVSEYVCHENEAYFDIALKYMYDRNDCWKYVFIISHGNAKASQEMVKKILSILHCGVIETKASADTANLRFVREMFGRNGRRCSVEAEELLVSALNSGALPRDYAESVITDIFGKYAKGDEIDKPKLSEYFCAENTVVKYLLNTERKNAILMLLANESKEGAIL